MEFAQGIIKEINDLRKDKSSAARITTSRSKRKTVFVQFKQIGSTTPNWTTTSKIKEAMKKIVLNISDSTYEKLRFEALLEQKSVQQIIQERVFHKPFHNDVEEAFDKWMNQEIEKIVKE